MPKRPPTHRPPGYKPRKSWDRPYQTRQQRGYGRAWEKVRAQVLARDSGLCVKCARNGRIAAATDVDHIIPKSRGGTDVTHNLQSLCRACHMAKTAKEGGSNL